VQYPTGISQRTWSTTVSEPITATLLRENLTAPLWLITSPPMAILAQQLSSQSVPNNARTTLQPLDTEYLDTGGGHSDSVNSFKYYAPTTGWWLLRGAIPYSGATTNSNYSFGAGIQVNQAGAVNYDGARHPGPPVAGAVVIPGFCELAHLTAQSPVTSSDEVQAYAYQDTGGSASTAINAGVGVFPWMSARWAGVSGGTAGLAVPSPAAFSDTTEITGAYLNGTLRDAINFLAFPPMARLSNSGASQSVPGTGADTAVTWNSGSFNGVASDNYSGWSSGSNPTRYTFPVAGRYYVWGQVSFAASNSGQWGCGLRVNGTTSWYGTRTSAPGTSTAGMILTAEKCLRVNAGDYVEVTGSQTTGSSVSLNTTAPSYSKLIVLWRGA